MLTEIIFKKASQARPLPVFTNWKKCGRIEDKA